MILIEYSVWNSLGCRKSHQSNSIQMTDVHIWNNDLNAQCLFFLMLLLLYEYM